MSLLFKRDREPGSPGKNQLPFLREGEKLCIKMGSSTVNTMWEMVSQALDTNRDEFVYTLRRINGTNPDDTSAEPIDLYSSGKYVNILDYSLVRVPRSLLEQTRHLIPGGYGVSKLIIVTRATETPDDAPASGVSDAISLNRAEMVRAVPLLPVVPASDDAIVRTEYASLADIAGKVDVPVERGLDHAEEVARVVPERLEELRKLFRLHRFTYEADVRPHLVILAGCKDYLDENLQQLIRDFIAVVDTELSRNWLGRIEALLKLKEDLIALLPPEPAKPTFGARVRALFKRK